MIQIVYHVFPFKISYYPSGIKLPRWLLGNSSYEEKRGTIHHFLWNQIKIDSRCVLVDTDTI